MVYFQFGKAADDVAQQHIRRGDDTEIFRFEALGIIVKNMRYLMQSDRSLARSGDPLHDGVMVGILADDLVLFFLDGCDDIPQDHVLMLSQIFDQKLVVGRHVAVVIAVQDALFDIEGPLQHQVHVHRFLLGDLIPGLAQLGLIVKLGYRCPPVDHDRLGSFVLIDRRFRNTVFADVNALLAAFRRLFVIDAAEIRLVQGLAVFIQLLVNVGQHAGSDRQVLRHLGVQLPIARGDLIVQFIPLLPYRLHFLLIQAEVVGYDLFCLPKMFLFVSNEWFHDGLSSCTIDATGTRSRSLRVCSAISVIAVVPAI